MTGNGGKHLEPVRDQQSAPQPDQQPDEQGRANIALFLEVALMSGLAGLIFNWARVVPQPYNSWLYAAGAIPVAFGLYFIAQRLILDYIKWVRRTLVLAMVLNVALTVIWTVHVWSENPSPQAILNAQATTACALNGTFPATDPACVAEPCPGLTSRGVCTASGSDSRIDIFVPGQSVNTLAAPTPTPEPNGTVMVCGSQGQTFSLQCTMPVQSALCWGRVAIIGDRGTLKCPEANASTVCTCTEEIVPPAVTAGPMCWVWKVTPGVGITVGGSNGDTCSCVCT